MASSGVFTFNTNPPPSGKGIRQAIVKGLNREAIALPTRWPTGQAEELMLGNHFFMPGQEGYQDNSADFAYDPEAAGAQLDEHWTLEDGAQYRTKDGEELVVEYQLIQAFDLGKRRKLLQSDMEKIGVKVRW